MSVTVAPDDPRDRTYDRRVAREFARLASGWWRGASARNAWLLTLALAALVIGNIAVNVAVNQWNRVFFDALERRDGGTLGIALAAFAGLVVIIAGETLQGRWRGGLVGRLPGIWLTGQRYYRLNLAQIEPANPEYRIADE